MTTSVTAFVSGLPRHHRVSSPSSAADPSTSLFASIALARKAGPAGGIQARVQARGRTLQSLLLCARAEGGRDARVGGGVRIERGGSGGRTVTAPRGPAVTVDPLAGSRWRVTLDIGREKNTWMDPRWAASGRRVEVPLSIQLAHDGSIQCLGVGPFMPELKVGSGEWRMDKGTLRFHLETSGFARGDVSIPAGRLYFAIPAWGPVISARGGMVTVRQRRWVVRKESRIVGTFKAEEGPGDSSSGLPPVRVSQGTWDGRQYESAPV